MKSNERKQIHKLIIPFPVCADAAIYYKEGRRLTDRREMKINERELKRIDKK